MSGFYGPDLAHVHDTGYGAYARDAAPDLLRRLRAAAPDGGLVVDLGCGSGIWARALLDAGFDVLGVDLSADLVAIARERAPEARFVHGSLLDAELPPCAAVTAMSEVVNYAADTRAGREALATLMRRVHAALRPGGLFMFDALGPSFVPPAPRVWTEGDGWVVCAETAVDEAARALTRRIVVFREDEAAGAWRRVDESHEQCLYEPAEVLADLRAAGFAEASALDAWGALDLRAGQTAFVAHRT